MRSSPLILLVALSCATPEAPEAVDRTLELGDERGAVVALPLEEPRALAMLVGDLPDDWTAAVAEVAPNVQLLEASSTEEAAALVAEVEAMDARFCRPELLRQAPDLRWVQAFSAGVDRYVQIDELVENDAIVLTNMRGVHGPAIAEHAFALLLYLTRDLGHASSSMAAGRWDRSGGAGATALSGRTLLVVGLGGIGSEIARRAKGFDMTVLATVRRERPAPAYVDRLALAPELDQLLPLADVVAIAVPLTDETRGLFDRERFARMKQGAYLVNIARGAVVDTDALLEALDSGRLAGAGLDVTDPEPLPADHPLWSRDDVIVTPHVAGRAELTAERRRALFVENVRRFAHGEPLLNVVDKRAGY